MMTRYYIVLSFAMIIGAACGPGETSATTSSTGSGGSGGSAVATTGAVMACLDATHCPQPEEPCYDAVCDGACHIEPSIFGTPCGPSQVCDGEGRCVSTPPCGNCDDANDCTVDICGDNICLHPHAPVGTPCGDGETCGPLGICGDQSECMASDDCDDGNPCTVDVCGGDPKVCHHSPTSGHEHCGTNGWCADGAGTCCDGGCNMASGSGYVCVQMCPGLSFCVDGFCI